MTEIRFDTWCSLLVLLITFCPAGAATFEVLPPVDVASGEKSVVVSDDGSVVLSTFAGSREHDSYVWTESQGVIASYSRYDPILTYGISGDGKTILTNGYGSSTAFYDASYDGSVRVGASGTTAAAIIGGQFQSLGKLNVDELNSTALAVSSDGSTIVGMSRGTPSGTAAFRWTAQTGLVPLGTLPGATISLGLALGVSADGSTIVGEVGSQNSYEEAFRWTAANGLEGLGSLPGGRFASKAYAVSADGNTVVGQSIVPNKAFIWDPTHGMRSLADVLTNDYHLDIHGLLLRNATDISASGNVIVGWASDAQNNAFAFRVNLVPEPWTASLLLIAGLFVTTSRKRI